MKYLICAILVYAWVKDENWYAVQEYNAIERLWRRL